MKRLTACMFVGMLGAGCQVTALAQESEFRTLADSLAQQIAVARKTSIAVVDFTDLQGNPTELGRYLAEECSVALTRSRKGFDVIDRAHLKALLAEHKLAATGLIDLATAKKLGQMVGADAILTGTMTPFSETVRITVKVLATDSAQIIAADTSNLPRTSTISELLGTNIRSASANDRPQNDRPPTARSEPSRVLPTSPVLISARFRYELTGCRGMANSVKCNLRITNQGADRRILQDCSFNTKAFDNFGNESKADVCSIANHEGQGRVDAQLVSGVSVLASVSFSNISPSATSLALINIAGVSTSPSGSPGMSDDISISFRNVPIDR